MEPTVVFGWGGNHSGQLEIGDDNTQKDTQYSSPKLYTFNIGVKQISCGEAHTAFITTNCELYTVGSNDCGRLGINDRDMKSISYPTQVALGFKASFVAWGWEHSAVIDESGRLFTWGNGVYGCLGNGQFDIAWAPVEVPLPHRSTVTDVSCGSRHTIFVTNESEQKGKLYAMGEGDAGQLGTGKRTREPLPTLVEMSESIKQTACGISHTVLVTHSGKVYTTGGNTYGQLGLDHQRQVDIPTRVHHISSYSITKVAAGQHTAALSKKGQLFIWGWGSFGMFLKPRLMKLGGEILDVDIGGSFGWAVDKQGDIWSWGENTQGQLGQGDFEGRKKPTKIPASFPNVDSVSCGGFHTIISQTKGRRNYFREQLRPQINRRRRTSSVGDMPTSKSESPRAMLSVAADSIYEKLDRIQYDHAVSREKRRDLELDMEEQRLRFENLIKGLTENHNRELKEQQANYIETYSSLQDQLNGVIYQTNDMKKQLAMESDKARIAENEAMHYKSEAGQLRSTVQSMDHTITAQQKANADDVSRYKTEINNLHAAVTDIENSLQAKQATNADLQNECNRNRLESEALKDLVEKLRQENRRQQEEINRLNDCRNSDQMLIQNDQRQLEEIKQVKDENLNLRSLFSSIQRQLEESLQFNDQLSAEIAALKKNKYRNRNRSVDTSYAQDSDALGILKKISPENRNLEATFSMNSANNWSINPNNDDSRLQKRTSDPMSVFELLPSRAPSVDENAAPVVKNLIPVDRSITPVDKNVDSTMLERLRQYKAQARKALKIQEGIKRR